jgi:hypothetical protein
MLHYETVDTPTLELLKALLSIDIFKDLRLVGGTSLSLQFGHRKSIDLDLFGKLEADIYEINEAVAKLGVIKKIHDTTNIHIMLINGIKVDIINYPYPWIGELITEDNLRMADKKDIAAMKLAAIAGRGTKKDLYDLYVLLQHMDLAEMLRLYEAKYNDGSRFMVLKSLVYFDDADADIMPALMHPLPWERVKDTILKAYNAFMKSGGGG